MDVINKEIELGSYITENPVILGKTWEDFSKEIKNKNLILYGITSITMLLWKRCTENISISAAIDNSAEKNEHKLVEFFDEDDLQGNEDIFIQSKEILKKYNPNDVVILISSRRSCAKIVNELEKNNFHCYFSVLHLEYYYREYMKKNNLPFKTLNIYKKDFAKKCAEKYPIEKNKIIFLDMGTYMDHGKYITNQLLSLEKNLDIVWFMKDVPDLEEIPKGVRILNKGNWKNYIYEMMTAKMWIVNIFPINGELVKRKEQIYIQIKHWSSITLKKFYLDDIEDIYNSDNNQNENDPSKMKGFNDVIYFSKERLFDVINRWRVDGTWIDYIISGSEMDEAACRKGFNFNGKFIRCGSPRSDILFQSKESIEKVHKKLKLNDNEKILLYVPTYRRYDFFNTLNFDLLLESLMKKWSGIWKILIRLHPFVKKESKNIKLPSFVIDVSNYFDGQELVAAADIMISDYSSIMFDPAYVLKPVFLYAPDKDIYLKKDRTFLIDYNSLPFPISTTNEELSKQILNFDEENYKQNVQEFLNKYGVNEDGHASERAARFILGNRE